MTRLPQILSTLVHLRSCTICTLMKKYKKYKSLSRMPRIAKRETIKVSYGVYLLKTKTKWDKRLKCLIAGQGNEIYTRNLQKLSF